MKTYRKLQHLLAMYSFALKLYRACPNTLTHKTCVSLHSKIEALIKANPGIEDLKENIDRVKAYIDSRFNVVSLILMDRKQAVQHVKNLVSERNNANLIFRPAYEKQISRTLAELRDIGITILIDTAKQDWRLLS